MGFRIVQADIATLEVDAIVNPTDQFYSGGGGVDRQLHVKCGKALYEATKGRPHLHLGEARATDSFGLPCRHIIHTSGPRWTGRSTLEIALLGSCYRNCVQLAHSLGCRTIAFPLIASKGKGFPKELAFTVAIDAISECQAEFPDVDITLTIYGRGTEVLSDEVFAFLCEMIGSSYEPSATPRIQESEPLPEQDGVCAVKCMSMSCTDDGGDFGELIDELLAHPTSRNLGKIPIDEDFPTMLARLMNEKGKKHNDILDALGISGAALWKILKKKSNPTKLTVFAMAIELKLDIEQTKDMLMKAGYAINRSSMQDVIVSGLIQKGVYDRYVIDELLFNLDLSPLPGAILS